MSLDLRGTHNFGEFYSQHYLDALFDTDPKELAGRALERCGEGGRQGPVKRLHGLANGYFRARALATGERDPLQRLALARDVHNALLDALGFTAARSCVGLDDGRLLPVVLAVDVQHKPHLWVLEAGFAQSEDGAGALDEAPLLAQRAADATLDGDAVLVTETYP